MIIKLQSLKGALLKCERAVMNKKDLKITLFFFILPLILLLPSCKKNPAEGTTLKTPPLVGTEVDVKKIESQTGISFKILKTESIGYTPLHKFYWVCLKDKINKQRLETLAEAIIKETIVLKPNTYHSFTIHFFWENELRETIGKSPCFARATFLPEGNWQKVGRLPIDDYKNYKLSCTFLE